MRREEDFGLCEVDFLTRELTERVQNFFDGHAISFGSFGK